MVRVSLNEMTTYRWSFEEDVAHAAAHGYSALGVWRQKLSDYGEAKGAELLAEHHLGVSNLLWAGGFTGSDGRSLKESISDALEAIQLAAELNAGCLVVYTGSRSGHTNGHARRLVREAFEQLLPVAETLGMTLAVEPMHPECAAGWTFLTSLEDTLSLLDTVVHPHLQLVLDTYHLGFEPRLFERLKDLVARTAIVHVGDGRPPRDREQDRLPLGKGQIPLARVLRAVQAAGYRGYYDIELMGPEIEVSDYHQLIGSARTFCETVLNG